jgi:outer membrane protein TolC
MFGWRARETRSPRRSYLLKTKLTAIAKLLTGRRTGRATLVAVLLPAAALAQTALSWQQIKEKFEATNPTLKAAQLNIDESRAAEITAYLRPNPDFGLAADGTQLTRYQGVYRPFAGTQISPSISYLHERQHKRELRRDQAKEATAVAESTYRDQERSLLFNLQSAFVNVLQAKAFLQNAKENLAYWDKELDINRLRFKAGDLAQVDVDRLELQRVQFESDFESAMVNLRTAKIQLLMLLNDRTPIEGIRRNWTIRFYRRPKTPARIPGHGAGRSARSEGLRPKRRVSKDHLQARGRRRLNRSDVQCLVDAQPFVQ